MNRIEKFFASRPQTERAYMTSDGAIHTKRINAEKHAKSLEVKKIETITKKYKQ